MSVQTKQKIRYSAFIPESFYKTRPSRLPDQLTERCVVLEEWLYQQTKLSASYRHIKVELFRHTLSYPFGKKPVIGILAISNTLEDHELFQECHFSAAIRDVAPDIQTIPQSFLAFGISFLPQHLIYIEISSPAHESEALQTCLTKRLPHSITEHIQKLIPAPFARPNQEELFHQLFLLNAELSEASHQPQVVISYQEHNQKQILFSVTMVRAITAVNTSVKSSFRRLESVSFAPIQSRVIGKLADDTYKEGNVFNLWISASPFLRKNYSIDLYRARHHVTQLLEQVIGPFRDFNGGLLQKQFEILQQLEESLGERDRSERFLLENFFFSFIPVTNQSILPVEPLKELYLTFLEVKAIAEQGVAYQHKEWSGHRYKCEIIQATDSELQEELEQAVTELDLEDDTSALTHFKVDGILYLGWLSFAPTTSEPSIFKRAVTNAAQSLASKRQTQKRLRIALKCAHPTLDPRITRSDESSAVVKLLFEGLTRVGKLGRPEPAMAESIVVSQDGLVYTFFLRKAFWSNGNRVTAYDFEAAWKNAIEPGVDSVYRYLFYCIKNAKRASNAEISMKAIGIEALDDRMLRITLECPTPTFTEMTAHWSYLPTFRGADQADPAWAEGQSLVCNGPYTLQNWHHRRELTLTKNPDYWDAQNVKIASVAVTLVEGVEEEISLFREKRLDLVRGLIPRRLTSRPDEALIEYETWGVYGLFFNNQLELFRSKSLRRALAAALDRQAIVKALYGQSGAEACSLLPSGFSQLEPLHYGDPKSHLAQACDELGWHSPPPITICYSDHPDRKAVLELVQQQLASNLGIECCLDPADWVTFFSKVRKGDFQVSAMTSIPWFSDPSTILQNYTHHPSSSNPAQWKHGPFIETIEKASSQLNLEDRQQLFGQAEKMLAEEIPILPLFSAKARYLKAPDLKGVQVGPINEFDLKWCEFEE